MIGVGQISDNPEYKDLNSINIDMWKTFNIGELSIDQQISSFVRRIFPSIVFRPNWVLITLPNTLFIAKNPSEKESATLIKVLAMFR